MRKINEIGNRIVRPVRYVMVAMFLVVQGPGVLVSYSNAVPQGLEEVNDALEQETDNIIQTGRLVSNIIVVISFVLLMLNIVFKVMDNSKATVVFLFILFLRGLYEIIF